MKDKQEGLLRIRSLLNQVQQIIDECDIGDTYQEMVDNANRNIEDWKIKNKYYEKKKRTN